MLEPCKEIYNLKKLINDKKTQEKGTIEKDFSKIIGFGDSKDEACKDEAFYDEFFMIGPEKTVYEVFS